MVQKIMKRFQSFFILLFLVALGSWLFAGRIEAANKMWWAIDLAGGTAGFLDAVDGDDLTDKDGAIVIRNNAGAVEAYFYGLDADSAAADASPGVISPETDAGDKRWLLAHLIGSGLSLYTAAGVLIATLPASAPTEANSVMVFADDGSSGWANLADIDTAIPYSGELTTEQVACWDLTTTPGTNLLKSCGAKTTDNSTAIHLLCKDDSGEIENCTLAGLAISGTTSPTITVEAVPANATVNAAGEVTIDTTTDQIRWYGTAQQQLSPILTASLVIPAPADTDDMNIMKAPYGMTIVGIDCIVQGTTSVTGQIQECDSAGANCADLDSDITCDADGAADDGTLTDSAIASGAWLRWKTTSLSGTPTFLTVTVKYKVVAD